MYHRLFICTMYDFYGLKLCTMYDSHSVYLRVLWTICMYKFNRSHVVVFHIFRSIYQFSTKIGRFLAKFVQKSSRKKSADLSVKPAIIQCFRFSLFICRLW
jgi:hypothetical protein